MKINLLDEEKIESQLTSYEKNLIRDLKLEILFEAMSEGDSYLYNLCEKILVRPLDEVQEILRRQEIMKDAIRFSYFFKGMYQITRSAAEETSAYRKFTEPKYYQIVPASKKIVTEVEITRILMKALRQIIQTLNEGDLKFSSKALEAFKQDMNQKFNEAYFKELEAYIEEVSGMKQDEKLIISDRLKLGLSNKEGVLNGMTKIFLAKENKPFLFNRLFNKEEKNNLTEDSILIDNTILANNKQELVEASLNSIFRLLSRFNRSVLSFFEKISQQFGFFGACSHLYNALNAKGIKLCMPTLLEEKNIFKAEGLIDLGLAIKDKNAPVGNTLSTQNKNLWIITGANQGGKTTFLRSVGISALMAQCGLFVGAQSYAATLYKGIYTHFPDEEDGSLSSGLLDQELKKLNQIIEVLKPGSLLLMNESFATTTEGEASYIAEEVTMGLKEKNIRIIFVTHLYEYAHKLYERNLADIIFYRAMRNEKGTRSYQLEEGEPLKTSYGMDLYLHS